MKNTKLVSYYWRRQLWGTGACAPLDFQQLIFFFFTLELYKVFIRIIAVISYVKCFLGFCIPQLLKLVYFSLTSKRKRVLAFVRWFVCISCYFMCVTSYFHVVLCPSSHQILVLPLLAIGWRSFAMTWLKTELLPQRQNTSDYCKQLDNTLE